MRRGARLERLDAAEHFLYVRHGRNAWSFECGRHVDPHGWLRASEPTFLGADLTFYAALSGRAEQPLVSCVMLVHDRPRLVPQAVAYFERQDYARRELVVVDDAPEPVDHLLPDDPRIRHVRLTTRHTVGAKRNAGCEAALGELVAHWDDDDWAAPWRLTYQTADLTQAGADVAGLRTILFFSPSARRAWRYVWPQSRPWAHGATLLYTKELWRRNAFVDVDRGEDSRFLWSGGAKRVHTHANERFYVGIVHPGNTSPKRTSDSRWQPHDVDDVERLLGDDAPFYARSGWAAQPST
jgi:glycosyltransferase involved in cell wall biosynthesis